MSPWSLGRVISMNLAGGTGSPRGLERVLSMRFMSTSQQNRSGARTLTASMTTRLPSRAQRTSATA